MIGSTGLKCGRALQAASEGFHHGAYCHVIPDLPGDVRSSSNVIGKKSEVGIVHQILALDLHNEVSESVATASATVRPCAQLIVAGRCDIHACCITAKG